MGGLPPLAPGGHGYLDFENGKNWQSIPEKIAPWSTGDPNTYTASYRNPAGAGNATSVVYGTRFVGSQNYYSAYRYERIKKMRETRMNYTSVYVHSEARKLRSS